MKKTQPESNPDPVLRRQAIASDVEAFLKSGKKIEQVPSGVSAQVNLGAKSPAAQAEAKAKEEAAAKLSAEAGSSAAGDSNEAAAGDSNEAVASDVAAPELAAPTEAAAPKQAG
jgi:hypothetical protein